MLKRTFKEMLLDMKKTAYFVMFLIAMGFDAISDWIMMHFFDGRKLDK